MFTSPSTVNYGAGKKREKNESLRKGGNVSDEKICIETSVAEKYTEMKKKPYRKKGIKI